MAAWQFSKALYTADLNGWTRFGSMQNHWTLLYREEEREMVPLCRDRGIGTLPWSPLARGLLARAGREQGATDRYEADDYRRKLYGDDDARDDVLDAVAEVARDLGRSPAQISLAWLLRQPTVVAPIVGATRIEHLDDAVGAVDLRLGDEELAKLEAPYRPRPVRGHS